MSIFYDFRANAGWMLDHRLWRWSNIQPALIVIVGMLTLQRGSDP